MLGRESVIGVLGAGTMGTGIAQVAATAGHPVRLFDREEGAAAAAVRRIEARLRASVEKGRRRAEEAQAILARIEVAADLQAMAGCGLVIEAVSEELATKRELFAAVEPIVGEACILATNTSSLSITAIGAVLQKPSRFLGMHFFNPAPAMRLVEIVSGLETGAAVAEAACRLAESWGKTPIRVRNTPGFVVNRVARPFYGEGLLLLAEGAADPATLDAVLRDCGGFPMGPCELTDLIGQDVNAAVTRSLFEAYHFDRRYLPPRVQLELVEAGRLGRKCGRGFYDYDANGRPLRPDPAAEAPAPPPRELAVEGDLGPATSLIALAERAGLRVARVPHGPGLLHLENATLMLADGLPASEHAARQHRPVLTFDLCLDYARTPRIALAACANCPEPALREAVGFFQALGKTVTRIGDVPGLIVMRTLAMLANEAAEAVREGVAQPEAIDCAMRLGLNYPEGPLAWAGRVGVRRLVQCLDHLFELYHDPRYRASLELRRRLWQRE